MKQLTEKALLVNLTISQWSAHKYDRKVSRKIEEEHNAHNAGRFNKILIAEDALKEVQKVAGEARSFLYANTLPWGNNGDRLLPSTNYFELVNTIRDLKARFETASAAFIADYPLLKEDARRRLNGMFNEADYPSVQVIETKFNMQITLLPISDTDDFRIKVDEEEVNNLKAQMELEINSRITTATRDIWQRIKDAVERMVTTLGDKDAVFRDSLVTNIRDLVQVLPRLNFTGNDDISNAIEDMKSLLVDPVILRKNKKIRNTKAEEAKAILAKINDFI